MDNDLYFMRLEEEQQFSEPETMSSSPEGPLQMIGAGVLAKERRFSWPWLAALLLFACGLGWFGYSKGFSLTTPQPLQAAAVAPSAAQQLLKTERIADLKVGLRVLAQTPESPGETPPPLEIPDPTQWRLFTLEQTKKDGGILRIELLRRVDGVASAVLTEEELLPPTIGLPLVAEVAGFLQPAVRLPARTVAFGADLGWKLSHTPNLDKLLIGKTLDLNLPEMGAVGEAKIVGISRCPEIEKGQGRVITGRFIHRAANVVDLLISGEEEPIGTTDNHPFWSEDRQEYVAAGELRVGENLRTVNGSQSYVQSIRPRGPPEDVYNLEVEGDHTYHVGVSGVLVHNSCINKHHSVPKFLGGDIKQPLTSIRKNVHDDLHSQLRVALKKEFDMNVGGPGGSRNDWRTFFKGNSGSQAKAISILKRVTARIDAKHGTNITSDLISNLKSKLFTFIP